MATVNHQVQPPIVTHVKRAASPEAGLGLCGGTINS